MEKDELEAARAKLTCGLKLSKQGSYLRRAPTVEAASYFQEAREDVQRILAGNPSSAEAWKLLALCCECQLDYEAAVEALRKHLSLVGSRTKDDLKRLARCQEYLSEWKALRLTPEELRVLGEYLESVLKNDQGRDFQHTRSWLLERGHPAPEAVLDALRERGAFDDWQVLHNVV